MASEWNMQMPRKCPAGQLLNVSGPRITQVSLIQSRHIAQPARQLSSNLSTFLEVNRTGLPWPFSSYQYNPNQLAKLLKIDLSTLMNQFLIKGSMAGGTIYLVYDQELLGPSGKSQTALQKSEEVAPPHPSAMDQFSQYMCEQTSLKIPQLPVPPKFNSHICKSWNSGIIMLMLALSVAPSKVQGYSKEVRGYLMEQTK
ncbi:MICOS complex subunit MIC13-like [Leptonychotes weddellii]|uniref:MICOS complex subunit MIC13 n=1 Tax=Leptonychotes weddellii TaxID=9713 RepID=A0A7F8QLU2_LEPWE|nr:MICOS complex subunit MIC13-like [Leptonychotes weddellii]